MYDIYIGSYQGPKNAAIHHWQVDESGSLHPLHAVAGIANPSYLWLDADRRRLYAVSEAESPHCSVVTLSLASDGLPHHRQDDVLRSTSGASPCHLLGLAEPAAILVANYGGGTLDAFELTASGAMGGWRESVRHLGHGRHPARQAMPHPHSSAVDPGGHFVWVCDLGLDAIVVYRRGEADGHLLRVASIATEPGSGPRMMTFHPHQPYFYVVHELDSTVGVYHYETDGPECARQQILPTLDAKTRVSENWPAHIAISADGKFLYVSNRGHDSLAVFAVAEAGDRLQLLRVVPTLASYPRHFAFTPDGRWILVAGQRADCVEVMALADDGVPEPNGRCWAVSAPSCIVVNPYKP